MYKLPPQTKMNRPMRTSQLYIQDNNGTYTQLYTQRFETIKAVSNKRTLTVRSVSFNLVTNEQTKLQRWGDGNAK